MEDTVLLFFSFLMEAIILWQYTSHHFIQRTTIQIRIVFLCVLYVMLFFLSLFRKIEINTIGFLIANCIFLYTQFKLRPSFALFHSAMLTAIMGVSELLFLGIIPRYFPHFLSNAGIGLLFYTIFSKILFFTAICFLGYLFREKNDNLAQHDHSDFFLILIPTSSILVMFTFVSIGETSPFAPQISIMVIISAIFLLTTNLLVFGINQYNRRKSREFTEMQLLLQKEADSAEYYEMLLSQNENQSILIHDIKKHLQSIKLLNEKGEPDKVKNYIHQLMEASDLKETSKICDNVMLNAILNRYQRQCNEKHIDFHADIRSNSLQHLFQNDLTALFCNMLDNAVASAANVPDAFIEMAIHKKENSPFVVIIMINSCPNVPEYDQDKLPVSHKSNKERHGFGIKSINKVVKKYHGNMQMYYDNDAAAFHTIITLKK